MRSIVGLRVATVMLFVGTTASLLFLLMSDSRIFATRRQQPPKPDVTMEQASALATASRLQAFR